MVDSQNQSNGTSGGSTPTFAALVAPTSIRHTTGDRQHRDVEKRTIGRADASQRDLLQSSDRAHPENLCFYEQDTQDPAFVYTSSGDTSLRSSTPTSSMPGDAAHRTTPVRKPRPRGSDRRRVASAAGGSRSSPGQIAGAPSSSEYFQAPSVNEHAGLQPQAFHYPSPPPPVYNQRAGFYGQYTAPTQPHSLAAGQTPYPYSYLRDFSPGFVDAASSPPQQPQHVYQHVHPHTPVYGHPARPHGEGFGHPASLRPFPRRQLSSPPSLVSPRPVDGNTMAPPYIASPPFPSMGYPSPPLLVYPQQFNTTTPPLHPSFGTVHFPAHAHSPRAEVDGPVHHGSWYYLPPHLHGYEGTHYGGGYPMVYPSFNPQPMSRSSTLASSASTSRPPPRSEPQTTIHSPEWPPPTVLSDLARDLSPSSRPPSPPASKQVLRREWHPRPPAQRSQWVMWVGNVPSNATEDELWKHFSTIGTPDGTPNSGVESIFLISRSNCAFVNFNSAESLDNAIANCNGVSLRPSDPSCPLLVCRIRRSADDLKSGVGGQRGIGIHKQWVREQESLKAQAETDTTSSVSRSGSEAGLGKGRNSSSTDSYVSTTSSFLSEYFPSRYFILKSLSEEDLNLSVETGLWATQRHNELLLDQAFRTSKDVYLIFSVNKSGEFFGYTRMTGRIRLGEGRVAWTARSDGSFSPPVGSPNSPLYRRHKAPSDVAVPSPSPEQQQPMYFASERGHLVDESPLQYTSRSEVPVPPKLPTPETRYPQHLSAPPKFGDVLTRSPGEPHSAKFSLDQHERRRAQRGFKLDRLAPFRAMRNQGSSSSEGEPSSHGAVLQSLEEGETLDGEAKPGPGNPPNWGECFKVEWLERRKVPFHRTRHLRNPWNKGREVKVSRDGTEVEPSIGKRLLEEWGSLASQ